MCQRPSSIKTRIKTTINWHTFKKVSSQRPSSIKTRIKTLARLSLWNALVRGQRPSSIKTRIKTQPAALKFTWKPVRDHLPLKQGLRLKYFSLCIFYAGQRPSSIKTRIKTTSGWNLQASSLQAVRDHLPLKQGLRLNPVRASTRCRWLVRDHLPLKQGLRLFSVLYSCVSWSEVRDHLPLQQGLMARVLLNANECL